jgi:hypothetical protein
MADEMMNEQGGNMGGSTNKGGKAWGWVVLIIIILLVIWGLFALGDNDAVDETDTDMEGIGEGLDEIEEGLEDIGDDLDDAEDAEAELDAEADAAMEQ